MELKQLVPIEPICQALGVSKMTVYRMIRENDFPVVRIRGRLLFNEEHVQRWIEAREEGKNA